MFEPQQIQSIFNLNRMDTGVLPKSAERIKKLNVPVQVKASLNTSGSPRL